MQLLVRMERRKYPLRLLLEACSYVFDAALEMSAGRRVRPGSTTLVFKEGVKDLGSGDNGIGADGNAIDVESSGSAQESWEVFNRQMDERDREVSEAAVGSSEGGVEALEKEPLPPPMLEVLKVSLSLLRRLSNRNILAAGPFASAMQAWSAAHPQVRDESGNDWRRGGGGLKAL